MSVSRHRAQIIAALKQVEAGRSVEDVGREYRVSQHTIKLCGLNLGRQCSGFDNDILGAYRGQSVASTMSRHEPRT